VVGTVGGTRQGLAASPSSNDWDRLQYGPGLQLNYLVFNFGGGRAAAVEQALQTVFAANYTFNKSIQDVILSVETAYYNLVAAKAGIEAVQANLKDAALALDTARERANAGVGTVLDVLQAQSSYDRALYDQATVKGLLKTDRGNLAQVLGFSADAPVDVEPPAAEAPLALSAKDMQGLIDAALQRRPDLAALRANVAAKRAAITVAGSTFWPSLYLTGQVNRDYYNNYDGEYFDNDWSYSAGLNLQWTLFDGLQTLYAKRAAAAQAESAQAQLVQAELAASADVWTSYADLETALEKCHASAAYLKSTSASYDLALDSYRNGLKSMLDVINAENDLAQARKQMIVSRQDAYLALAKLAYATGLLEKGGSLKLKDVFLTPVRKDQP
jgi:outer membrane protein TolC